MVDEALQKTAWSVSEVLSRISKQGQILSYLIYFQCFQSKRHLQACLVLFYRLTWTSPANGSDQVSTHRLSLRLWPERVVVKCCNHPLPNAKRVASGALAAQVTLGGGFGFLAAGAYYCHSSRSQSC